MTTKTTNHPDPKTDATPTQLMRWSKFSREKTKAVCARLRPSHIRGRVLHYKIGDFIEAASSTPETQTQRKARLDADLSEERLRRMRSESIPLQMSRDILADIMELQIEAVQDFPDISEKSRASMLKSMRANKKRLLSDLETCRFPQAEPVALDQNK